MKEKEFGYLLISIFATLFVLNFVTYYMVYTKYEKHRGTAMFVAFVILIVVNGLIVSSVNHVTITSENGVVKTVADAIGDIIGVVMFLVFMTIFIVIAGGYLSFKTHGHIGMTIPLCTIVTVYMGMATVSTKSS